MRYLEEHYSAYDEDGRLSSRHGSVEYLTTMKYIHAYVKPGANVLEVGAGTGRYSLALSREGYDVTAIELLEHNIDVFRSKLTPEDLFEMVRLEQIERLNAASGLRREKIVAADLFTRYLDDRIDTWSEEVFGIYLDYHFTVCERPELLGVTDHALDILRRF